MELSTNIVDRIRVLANSKGLNLPNLEVELGLGNGTISRWSKSAPNTDKLAKVASYFDVTVDYLLGRNEILDNVYFSFAKDAQDSGIDPDDIRAVLDIIKRAKEKG